MGPAQTTVMTVEQADLWRRIERFQFDEPEAELSFSLRLARDNGWSPSFATAVIDEYRRFLFLAMEAGHPVTPSEEVDQAWHLHLTYTHSYWDDLCANVLRQPLHHGPTKGGRSEGHKFDDWYTRTLESYERFFGQAAPARYWPSLDIRFGEAASYQRVNKTWNWVIPKPRRSVSRPLALGVGTGLALTGCAAAAGSSTALFAVNPAGILGVAVAAAAVLFVLIFAGRGKGGGPRRGGDGGGSSGFMAGFGWGGGDSGCGSSGCGGSGCGGGGCGGGGCGGG